ncbi:MAG: hypothetical protein U9Q99_02950 [Nanoarchaeota archaeon]|nr:hypothetical protein [Nanoarchaeota archaeon]
MSTFLQAPLFTDFLYPFLLVFFIIFAVLEKTSIFGKDKKQINAMISLVIGLIFVSVIFPKIVLVNLTLFLSIALIVVFVATVLWGFLTGEGSLTIDGGKKVHKLLMWIFIVGLFLGIIWAFGILSGFTNGLQKIFSFLFISAWSGGFWMNFIFIFLIVVAVAIAIGWNPFKGGSWFIKVK